MKNLFPKMNAVTENAIINVMDKTIIGLVVVALAVWAPHVYRFTQNGYWF